MSQLVVTFSRVDSSRVYDAPVAKGSDIRTEVITMDGVGSLVAEAGEEIVELIADADCWVAIGVDPASDVDTDGTSGSRFIKADIPYTYGISADEKVAVVGA